MRTSLSLTERKCAEGCIRNDKATVSPLLLRRSLGARSFGVTAEQVHAVTTLSNRRPRISSIIQLSLFRILRPVVILLRVLHVCSGVSTFEHDLLTRHRLIVEHLEGQVAEANYIFG